MADYAFKTRWRLLGTCEQIYSILEDVKRTARFWPELYRSVIIEEPGDANGVGRVVRAQTKGFLPYVINWKFRVTESRRPHGFSIEAWGDLVGTGCWTFSQDGEFVDVRYDWIISADKPLLKYFSFVLRPLFAWNHDYVMRKGLRGLKLELSSSH